MRKHRLYVIRKNVDRHRHILIQFLRDRVLEAGEQLLPWKEITIRCHDFRVDFCTRAYFAGIPIKTLQTWMGHADTTLIMQVYAKLTQEQEETDAEKLRNYLTQTI